MKNDPRGLSVRLGEIKAAGEQIADAARLVKETADKLRADVDELSVRVGDLEGGSRPTSSQAQQDARLNDLESSE